MATASLLRKEFVLRAFRQVLRRRRSCQGYDSTICATVTLSALLASGADVQAVSARLGHANVSMTT